MREDDVRWLNNVIFCPQPQIYQGHCEYLSYYRNIFSLQRFLKTSFAGPFLVMETRVNDSDPEKPPGAPTCANLVSYNLFGGENQRGISTCIKHLKSILKFLVQQAIAVNFNLFECEIPLSVNLANACSGLSVR